MSNSSPEYTNKLLGLESVGQELTKCLSEVVNVEEIVSSMGERDPRLKDVLSDILPKICVSAPVVNGTVITPVVLQLGEATVAIRDPLNVDVNSLQLLLNDYGVQDKSLRQYIAYLIHEPVTRLLGSLKVREPAEKKIEELASTVKITEKERLIDTIFEYLSQNYTVLNVNDTLECYENGVYVECEDKLAREIERLAESHGLRPKTTRYITNEVIAKLKRKYWVDHREIKTRWFTLAFENGLVDVYDFVESGYINIEPFSPSVYVQHRIPHRIADLNDFMTKEYGLEHVSKGVDIKDLAEKQVPFYHKVFSEWVEDPVILYEIIGYCFYKSYPLHRAFMLVGEGSNGKSTYLELLKHVLGRENIVSIALQAIAQERFAPSQLYKKLANIFADLPKQPLKYTGIFKMLTGEDEICADRKFRDPICFKNYAKLIFSANELPEVSDQTYAFWRRWIIVEFPNRFPENKDFKKQLLRHEQLPKLITVSLYALRNVLLKGDFSLKGDFKEKWLKRANNVYAFIVERVEKCNPREPDCFVTKSTLYEKYVEYCDEVNENAYTKRKFNEEIERWTGAKTDRKIVGGQRVRVWVGIRLKEEDEEEEQEESPSLLPFSSQQE